jgi:niacin transporter
MARVKREALRPILFFGRFFMSGVKKMVIAALLVALGVILPMAFHFIPNAGRVFLPMHIPILLCGIICGLPYGPAAGIVTPLLSSLITGMPAAAMLPSMLCELAAYGAASAVLMRYARIESAFAKVYVSLIGAMLFGRVFYGALNSFVFSAGSYSMQVWLAAAFITALPGVAIQITVIPAIVAVLRKAKLIAEI